MSKAADGSEQRQTLMTSLLEKSERVGFTRDGQGRLVAMAGGDEPEVLRGDGTYLWQVQAQKGDIDSGKTALLVATVLTLGAALAVGSFYWAVLDGLDDEPWHYGN